MIVLPDMLEEIGKSNGYENKIVCFAKIWRPPRQQGFLKDFAGIWQSEFLRGRTYFTLLGGIVITYTNGIGSNAARALLHEKY